MYEMKKAGNGLTLIAVTAGIVSGSWLRANPLWWLLFFLTLVAGSLIFFILNRSSRFDRERSGLLVLTAIFCLAGLRYGMAHRQYHFQGRVSRIYHEQQVEVTGVQIRRSEAALHGGRFLLQAGSSSRHQPLGKITVYYRGKAGDGKRLPATYGRKLQVRGRFKAISAQSGRFPDYLEQQGITGYLYAEKIQVLVKEKGLPLPYLWAEQIREKMLRSGKRVLSPINGRLLHGMIFNDALTLASEDRKLENELRRTGTIHLMSVSGLHVGFVVLGLTWLLVLLRIPGKLQMIPLVLGVAFYIMMTGMGPPVLRAGMMMIIYAFGKLFGANTKDQVNRLALAAVLLLFGNPYDLFAVGFQLSVIATLGVVWLYPILKEYFPIRGRLAKPLWEAVLISLSAQIMVTPVIVLYFHQISWCSPLANLLFFLPSEGVIMGGISGESLALLFPAAARFILIAVDWNLTMIRWIAHFLAGWPWAASWSPAWPWPWMVAYYLALLLILDLLRPNFLTKKRLFNGAWIILGVLGLLNLAVWAYWLKAQQGRYLEFTVIDVGQGDALFVRTAEGVTMLMDGGDEGKGIARVIPFLHAAGVERLDLVIASHGHRDHLYGLAEVLTEVPAGKLYVPENTDTADFQSFLRRIRSAHIPLVKVFPGDRFRLGADVDGQILGVPAMDEENDRSLVVLLKYGKNKLLLTGDLSRQGEVLLSRKYPALLRASVLKVGHHGSGDATTLSFLTQIKPKVGVISVGAGNRYGHPAADTLGRLHSLGVHLYRTDRHGRITVRLYGKGFTVTAEKN